MGVYKERLYRSYDIAETGGIRLKPYSISVAAHRAIDIGPALDYAGCALLASPIPWLHHRGLGFLMYHEGEDANWLLLRIWVEGDIQAGLIAANHGHGFKPLTVPFYECVWESVIACHERDAWVRRMMSAAPDPDAYLNDKLQDGFH